MKRFVVAIACAAVLGSSAGCGRGERANTGLVKVGDHSWAVVASGPTFAEGLGANSGFVVGRDGVAVIDSRLTPVLARELLDHIRTVTAAPIRFVINTHYHQDHAWGNSVFKDEGAAVVATAETRDAFVKYSPIYLDFYRARGAQDSVLAGDVRLVPPDSIFAGEAKLDLGGVAIELRHFGPGHTAGDAVIVVPKDRVAFAGGLLSDGYHPNLGDPGADFDNWLRTLDRLRDMGVRRFVPGQGRVCGWEAIESERRYIEAIREISVDGIRKLYPLMEIIRTIALPETEGWLQANLVPFNVQAVYRREIPRIVRPDFTIDLPPDLPVLEGGRNPQMGYIRWGSRTKEGYVEIEVQWKSSSNMELIVQDITEAVARYGNQKERLMTVESARRFERPDGPAVRARGVWKAKKAPSDPAAGRWSWTMVLRGGKMYVIQCSTGVPSDEAAERRNIEELERIAGTFRAEK